jgi:hypothetical protein
MAIYIDNKKVIDDYNEVIVGQYSTRANLPAAGVVGYVAYVTDQNELVVNTGQTVHPSTTNSPPAHETTTNSPDTGITWYKILTNPLNSQIGAVLNQGTLAGGYNGSSIWNQISNIKFATDATTLMQQTLPWATRYSSAHSTNQYAYYHSGDITDDLTIYGNLTTPGYTCKQAWATDAINMTVSGTLSSNRAHTLNPITNNDVGAHVRGFQACTWQSGSAIDTVSKNIGVIQYGSDVAYIDFITDTWFYDVKYSPPVAETYGWAASGSSYSSTTGINLQKFQWSTSSWTGTGKRSPYSSYHAYQRGMSTGWNKSYDAAYQYLDKWDETAESWSALLPGLGGYGVNYNLDGPMSLVEISSITGQNWGYWFGIPYTTGPTGGYSGASRKTLYATDTTFNNLTTYVGIAGWSYGRPASGNSACTSTGP